jgi:hypothetical protein
MGVDISGLRLRIDTRTSATVARCHGEYWRRKFHKVSTSFVGICRDFVANEILILKRVLYPLEG